MIAYILFQEPQQGAKVHLRELVMGNVLNLRRAERKLVTWNAIARCGDLLVRGTILDWTIHGLFFEPTLGYDRGFVADDAILDGLEAGDKLEIIVAAENKVPECQFSMEVRWLGYSQTHACYGFGAERIAESMRLAA